MTVAVHWFRNDQRLHDNPALVEAVNKTEKLIALYIFDETTFDPKRIGYNPLCFFLESLKNLNDNLTLHGGCLYILQGCTVNIFKRINEKIGVDLITYQQTCEQIFRISVKQVIEFCNQNKIKCIEKVSHTLWDPYTIIKENGGVPPFTFKSFQTVANRINQPPRPVGDINWSNVNFQKLPRELLEEFKILENPTPEFFEIYAEVPEILTPKLNCWYGGETSALKQLKSRLEYEEDAFINGFYLPNQVEPDLLGQSSSLSASLRYGCLSIRTLYWELTDLFVRKFEGNILPQYSATSQLIWRDYFYTMSIDNENFGRMEHNPACLTIAWNNIEIEEHKNNLECWKNGMTGYPFIDAGMRQLKQEGWIHHVVRNSVACFLTRGDLWISWTEGLQHFLKYLIDGDFSVCSGNWIWVSSSTFDQILDCPLYVCPVSYGYRFDPTGEYIRRYVPELKNIPDQYLYEPWKCPESVQKQVGCIIGKDYPSRIVDHAIVSRENRKKMQSLRSALIVDEPTIQHCCPSDEEEIKHFVHLPNYICNQQIRSNIGDNLKEFNCYDYR